MARKPTAAAQKRQRQRTAKVRHPTAAAPKRQQQLTAAARKRQRQTTAAARKRQQQPKKEALAALAALKEQCREYRGLTVVLKKGRPYIQCYTLGKGRTSQYAGTYRCVAKIPDLALRLRAAAQGEATSSMGANSLSQSVGDSGSASNKSASAKGALRALQSHQMPSADSNSGRSHASALTGRTENEVPEAKTLESKQDAIACEGWNENEVLKQEVHKSEQHPPKPEKQLEKHNAKLEDRTIN